MGRTARHRPFHDCLSRVCICAALLNLLLLSLLPPATSAGVDKRIWGAGTSKLSGVIIPGFASTRLRAWAMLDCPYSPLDFSPLDPVWIDVRKVLSVLNCWLKCMMLDRETQEDHPECKSRPDTGLSAITELDPGYITGPASSVWREWVNWCVEFGIEADAIVAVPYDWRLSGPLLEKRDLYFHKLKIAFETARKLKGGPSVVFAHSLGNNVFRYFLEWLKQEVAPKSYMRWLDDHVHSYFAVGAPLLGAAETLKALLTGITFGLPISEGTARLMGNTFGSSLWMLPFSPYCHADPKRSQKYFDGVSPKHFICDAEQQSSNSSGWPVDVVTIERPSPNSGLPGISTAYPEVPVEAEIVAADPSTQQCNISSQKSYSAHDVSDGTFFREISDIDPTCNVTLQHLIKYYLEDPVLNPLTPWERPPIKNVFCMYGIDLKTEVAYTFTPTSRPYPDSWQITDIVYETEGGVLKTRSGAKFDGDRRQASGDLTVPYHSLSYCKNWLGPRLNITRTPQRAHDGSDVQEEFDMEHELGQDIVSKNLTRDAGVKYITFYEDATSRPGKKTAVWEIDKVDHRNILRSPVFLRELWLEIVHSYHPSAKRHFVSKAKREPLRDEDCYWDYGKARCGFSERCEYRYVFGDVHLGQSCRLKASIYDDHLRTYL
ncbi:hypothetical protein R1flu_010723 [Riccia fluitans]|uniref:Phospholipid--sterol O-acyltransferase n=1 Tax=Riccia fluitans TaxID=41844 RepID=A0ABD1Z5S2_9MARC